MLSWLIFLCYRKDPEEYFTFPVTNSIAPDYSAKIKKPMDFYTMRQKMDNGDYNNVDDLKVYRLLLLFLSSILSFCSMISYSFILFISLRILNITLFCIFEADIDLVCANALEYNEEHTVYSFAARKLKTVTDYIFSRVGLSYDLFVISHSTGYI